MKNYYSSLLKILCVVFLVSCSRQNKVSVQILNDALYSVCSEDFDSFYKNVLKLKVQNHTNKYQVLYSRVQFDNVFPKANSPLSYENLNVIENDSLIHYRSSFLFPYDNEKYDALSFLDDLEQNYLNHLLISSSQESIISKVVKKRFNTKTITLAPRQTLYFEVPFSFPVNSLDFDYGIEFMYLKNHKDYKVKFKILSDSTQIKKYLSDIQLLNLETNKMEIFHGEIVSDNSVPIYFKEKQDIPYWQVEESFYNPK